MTALSANRTLLALGLTGLTAGLAAAAHVAIDADRLLSHGMGAAFGARALTAAPAASRLPFDPSGLHLSAWRDGDGLGAGLLNVGDRITITGADGRVRVLDVVESRVLDGSPGDGGDDAPLVLVTTRAAGEPDRIVRFVVERPVETRTTTSQPHRAL